LHGLIEALRGGSIFHMMGLDMFFLRPVVEEETRGRHYTLPIPFSERRCRRKTYTIAHCASRFCDYADYLHAGNEPDQQPKQLVMSLNG
jgi:hypothetical protein